MFLLRSLAVPTAAVRTALPRRHASVLSGAASAAALHHGPATTAAEAVPQLRYILEGVAGFAPAAHYPPPSHPSRAARARWTLAEIDRMTVQADRLLAGVRDREVRARASAAAASSSESESASQAQARPLLRRAAWRRRGRPAKKKAAIAAALAAKDGR